ncbi:uncharacterized protein MEPE_04081 [Melanopsichium pennsylvanicum]|uniref:Uncharacterized protein n=1 Tax=Melanopsichium pennsylvanicum TaxID=63383 RepID=A0AAJ4XNC0_9BASI|nr:uncharacterized protein MEPE_04081 [Melanopsichium pennsylvanicum]
MEHEISLSMPFTSSYVHVPYLWLLADPRPNLARTPCFKLKSNETREFIQFDALCSVTESAWTDILNKFNAAASLHDIPQQDLHGLKQTFQDAIKKHRAQYKRLAHATGINKDMDKYVQMLDDYICIKESAILGGCCSPREWTATKLNNVDCDCWQFTEILANIGASPLQTSPLGQAASAISDLPESMPMTTCCQQAEGSQLSPGEGSNTPSQPHSEAQPF